MVGYLRRHHVAFLALLVALGGTSYAAVGLAKDSVGAKQIKRSAVRSVEVKDRSLRARDFKPGELPAGPAGPSGFVSSRAIAGSAVDFGLPGGMGNQEVTPANCRTSLYTAGPGEVAVINMQITAAPDPPDNNVLYLKVMASENGGPFASLSGLIRQANSLNISTTHVSNSHVQHLTAGVGYIWGAGLASNSAVDLDSAYCNGNITIYRAP
jgi:hypothetical protein